MLVVRKSHIRNVRWVDHELVKQTRDFPREHLHLQAVGLADASWVHSAGRHQWMHLFILQSLY